MWRTLAIECGSKYQVVGLNVCLSKGIEQPRPQGRRRAVTAAKHDRRATFVVALCHAIATCGRVPMSTT